MIKDHLDLKQDHLWTASVHILGSYMLTKTVLMYSEKAKRCIYRDNLIFSFLMSIKLFKLMILNINIIVFILHV